MAGRLFVVRKFDRERAVGLMAAPFAAEGFGFQDALIISIPVMASVLVSCLPPNVAASFRRLLIPVASSNGFVASTLMVILLEPGLLRQDKAT